MKDIIKVIVQVIHIVSFCGVVLVGALGILYEIIGYAKFQQILSAIGMSKGFERIWGIGIITLFLLILTHLIKAKL